MLLGRRERVIENLDLIKRSYLKLVLLKQHEREAYGDGNYEHLYELSENERLLIEDINGLMRYIVPDLLSLRGDSAVRDKMTEIDELQEMVISDSLQIKNSLEESIYETKRVIENIKILPKRFSSPAPLIVNIRA